MYMTDSGSVLVTGSVTDDAEGVKEKENETNYRDAERPSFPEPGKGRECKKNSEADTEFRELTTYELSLWKRILTISKTIYKRTKEMEHHKGILRFPNSPISREVGEEINVGCENKCWNVGEAK